MESIRLLIRRGAEPGLYVQPWGECLPLAIYGSDNESAEGLRDALILLIINGADVYAKDRVGRSVADIAYNARTRWWYDDKWHRNGDLRLGAIWREALAACGYDVEEVISRSLQVAEVSKSDYYSSEDVDDYDSSEDENEDNDSTDQDDENITQIQGPELPPDSPNNSLIFETCRLSKESTDNQTPQQTGSDPRGHFDWSLLEDDTNVWRT